MQPLKSHKTVKKNNRIIQKSDESRDSLRLPRHFYPFVDSKLIYMAALAAVIFIAAFVMSGCTLKDIMDPMFRQEASEQEETAAVSSENNRLHYAQVNNSAGEALVLENGEPVTVLAAYETAVGGEPKRNENGELLTHPEGELVTYAPGSAVLSENGETQTYAGGETVRDILGFPEADESGNVATRAAGEIVTHGEDELVYDENGERMTYHGEPLTYHAGEYMYNEAGEPETYPVAVLTDQNGETATAEDGTILVSPVELMTDESGNPVIEENGEAATKVLEPLPPKQVVQSPIGEGNYYIHNLESEFVFFAGPSVQAENVAVLADDQANADEIRQENGTGTIRNLQLELLGENLPYFEMHLDPEGYAYFVLEGTDQVLTVNGKIRDGVNVLLKDIEKKEYPQYKYWDNAPFTVADNQKWIIKELEKDTYTISSFLNPEYVMMADDQFGLHYANLILWKYDERDLQKFAFSTDKPVVKKYFEEGTYYISSGLSDWMMVSVGDYNYYNGSPIFLQYSDQGEGQMFRIKYDEYGFATFYHGDSNQVLTISNGLAQNGQEIVQYEADGGDWQKWIIVPHKHGGYYIRSAINIEEVIDLQDGEARREKPILMHWNNDTMAESWNFNKEEIASPYAYYTMDDYAQNFSSMTDYLVMVSSDTNHVGVYYGSKGNWTNLYYWDCVTGKQSTPTVKGEFSIYCKSESFDGNMDSPVDYTCYYASGWYPQYFFHSIIYYKGTKDVMDSSMGYNGSHGCVRLYTENAQWIYDNVPLDTKVVSY